MQSSAIDLAAIERDVVALKTPQPRMSAELVRSAARHVRTVEMRLRAMPIPDTAVGSMRELLTRIAQSATILDQARERLPRLGERERADEMTLVLRTLLDVVALTRVVLPRLLEETKNADGDKRSLRDRELGELTARNAPTNRAERDEVIEGLAFGNLAIEERGLHRSTVHAAVLQTASQ